MALFRVDVSGHGEASLQDLLSVVDRSFEELFEVGILGHLLVFGLAPLGYSLQHRNIQ